MKVRIKKHVRVLTANNLYDLSEDYYINDIFNKVIGANDHTMLRLYDKRHEPIYIRASMIESIGVITEN